MSAKRQRQSGFMLLEVLLATALVAVAMVAILDSLGRCLAASRSVQNYNIAQTLLANKSYEFRVERPTDYLDQSGQFPDYPQFTWARTFEMTDTEGLFKQRIAVYWLERGRLTSDEVVEYRYLPDKQR
jgi:type II secretion system protein I